LPSRHPIEVLAAAYGLYDLPRRALLTGVAPRGRGSPAPQKEAQ
jgi:hypothetical protein